MTTLFSVRNPYIINWREKKIAHHSFAQVSVFPNRGLWIERAHRCHHLLFMQAISRWQIMTLILMAKPSSISPACFYSTFIFFPSRQITWSLLDNSMWKMLRFISSNVRSHAMGAFRGINKMNNIGNVGKRPPTKQLILFVYHWLLAAACCFHAAKKKKSRLSMMMIFPSGYICGVIDKWLFRIVVTSRFQSYCQHHRIFAIVNTQYRTE